MWFTEQQDVAVNSLTQQGFIGRITTSGQLTEFPLPTKYSDPYAIAAGGDGNVWFTEDASAIGRITPQGVVTEFPIPTQQPIAADIALGPDGNMWFTESRTDKVARIDPQGHITEFDLPSGAGPEGLVTGPDHNLWIVESGSNNVARFNVTTHALTEFPIPSANSEAEYIAVGPDGNLYFTEANFFNYPSQGRIGRISTNGTMLEIPIPNSSRDEPWDIVAGPDGNLWFTEEFGREVVSMAPPTNVAGTQEKGTSSIVKVSAHQAPPVTQLSLPETSDVAPNQGTRAPDGSLYFTESRPNGYSLARIGLGGKVTEIKTPTASVGTIATGSDGNIWYCDNNNGLDRLNPTTGVTTNFPTPSQGDCHDVVAGADGNLWYDNPGARVFGKMTTSGVATEFPRNDTVYPGPGGSVWITENSNVERLNSDGTIAATYPIPSQLLAGNLFLVSTTGGADGNLWFTAEMQDPTQGGPYFGIVGRVNVITGKIDVFKTGIRGSSTQIQGLTAAPDGNLYAAFGGNGTGPAGVLVMNTSGQIVSKQLFPAGYATPAGIAVGPSLTNNKNGWAVYTSEAAINQFAVVQGNGG
jgi:streptogramin lyase